MKKEPSKENNLPLLKAVKAMRRKEERKRKIQKLFQARAQRRSFD